MRDLFRDRKARDREGVFVCEGPRVVAAALDEHAPLLECFLGRDASTEARAVAERVKRAGIAVRSFDGRIGDTVTPQAIVATVTLERRALETLTDVDLVVVVTMNDPGNAGTLIRSAAAAGAQAVIFGAGSVDAYNPKVVRASAGACFAVHIVEAVAVVEVVEALGARGIRAVGATLRSGSAPETVDLTQPTALVLGHETRGLPDDIRLDARVTIPMYAGESLNVAMAGTVLLFEAARQRGRDGR